MTNENGVIHWISANTYDKAVIYGDKIQTVKPSALIGFEVAFGGRDYSVALRPSSTPGWMQGTWQDLDNRFRKPQALSARLFVGETGVMLHGTWREDNRLYDFTLYLPNKHEGE